MEKKSVLVVDDDQFLVDLLVEKLQTEGFLAKGVFSGQEALDSIKESIPDIILLDLIMPGMTGIEVLQKLKSDDQTRNIPVVVLTNLADNEIIEQIKTSGGSGYLIKDAQNIDEVVESIKNLI